MRRARRGRDLPPQVAADGVQMRYAGLDDVTRACAITFHPPPHVLSADRAEYDIALADRGRASIYVDIGPAPAGDVGEPRFRALAARARRAMRSTRRRGASIECSGELFGVWLAKSRADLALLTTELPTGPYPYAGIPWFATTFGRDGIVTALQMLWIDPSIARGVLSFLAAHQAGEPSAFSDAGVGKVLHETRRGEMAMLGEVPFARYFGGVDQTPLFVMLAGAYAQRTGDLELIDRLWPSLVSAMGWIEGASIDGLLVYRRGAATGLANQGWKDSADSVFHADGSMALSPIALVEVQGYAHAACVAMAALARMRGDPASAQGWLARAEDIRSRVEAQFWMEDEGFYGIALDAQRALCRVCASNAGPPALRGPACPGSCDESDGAPDRGPVRLGLRHSHARARPGQLQSHVVSQRIGVAARHGDLRSRIRALRQQAGGGTLARRIVSRGVALRHAHARAALRLRAPSRRAADRISRRVPAAGVVRGCGVHGAAGVSRRHHRCRCA
jgi:glycogen debranching enzyme